MRAPHPTGAGRGLRAPFGSPPAYGFPSPYGAGYPVAGAYSPYSPPTQAFYPTMPEHAYAYPELGGRGSLEGQRDHRDRERGRPDARRGEDFSPFSSEYPPSSFEPALPARPEELAGRVMALSRDQNGCRLLQQRLDDGQARLQDLVFSEVLPHLPELMSDPFGNYLFQKLVRISAMMRS